MVKSINKQVPTDLSDNCGCASCLSFQLFQLGSTTNCSVLTSPNKDETGLSALAC